MRSSSNYALRLMLFCVLNALNASRLANSQELQPAGSQSDSPSITESQSPSPEPIPPKLQDQPFHTLLLKNGELLSGRVYRQVDTIVLTTDRGATMRIPDRQIARFCRDRTDAFQYKSRMVDTNDASKMLELGEWALRHEMFAECESTLGRIQQLQQPKSRSTQSQIETLNQRLLVACDRAGDHRSTRAAVTHRGNDSAVTPVPQRRAIDLSVHERALLATFSKNLQPLMTNQCATAGCHGQSSATHSKFVLCRPVRGRGHTNAQSIANLHATLAYINQDDPLASRLVTALRELPAHNPFLIEAGDGQIAKVERWLTSLAPDRYAAARVEPEQTVPIVPAAAINETVAAEELAMASAELAAGPVSPPSPESDSRALLSSDPYDPAAFNDSE